MGAGDYGVGFHGLLFFLCFRYEFIKVSQGRTTPLAPDRPRYCALKMLVGEVTIVYAIKRIISEHLFPITAKTIKMGVIYFTIC